MRWILLKPRPFLVVTTLRGRLELKSTGEVVVTGLGRNMQSPA